MYCNVWIYALSGFELLLYGIRSSVATLESVQDRKFKISRGLDKVHSAGFRTSRCSDFTLSISKYFDLKTYAQKKKNCTFKVKFILPCQTQNWQSNQTELKSNIHFNKDIYTIWYRVILKEKLLPLVVFLVWVFQGIDGILHYSNIKVWLAYV